MNVLKALMIGTLTSALALTAVSASAQTINRQVKLSWVAPSTCEGGAALSNCAILGYSVQKLIGTTWTEIGTTTSSILTYTESNLAIGTYTYRVLATSEAGPSKPSNQVSKSFNVPGAPGNLVITVTVVIE
jgi:hypothetical protein